MSKSALMIILAILLVSTISLVVFFSRGAYEFKSGVFECDETFGGQTVVGQFNYKERTYKFPGFHSISITHFYDGEGNRIDEPFMTPGCEKIW